MILRAKWNIITQKRIILSDVMIIRKKIISFYFVQIAFWTPSAKVPGSAAPGGCAGLKAKIYMATKTCNKEDCRPL